jgi:NDP-sugar pyrophosphorylase family protein
VVAGARAGDDLCHIAGAGCPYTLPIAGRPLVWHAIACLEAAGIQEFAVLADPEIRDEIVVAIDDPLVAVHSSLDDARDALGDGPVLVHLGDSLAPGLPSDLRAGVVFTAAGRAVAGTVAELPEAGLDPALEADAELVELDGAWKYDGTVDGVLEANSLALDELKRARIGADLSRASIEGRVAIDPSAVLDGAKIRGPAQIGPGAVLLDTYVGPYTSIGANVRLESVEIEHSIVLDSAVIRFPGRRLEASLVGEGAQIGRDFTLPSALRLRVGRGSDIQLG